MVRTVRGAARWLVAAGAVLAALAVPASSRARQPGEPHVVGAIKVNPGQARLEAMKVELALLAEPLLYHLPLEVRVEEGGLELRGQVGEEKARRLALRVARQACYLPVHDGLKVSTSRPGGDASSAALRRAARSALLRHLSGRISKLEVEARVNGQVTLRGQAQSMEDKLTASRCLRAVPGCASVVNCLTVRSVRHAGHTVTLITSDGKHVVHGPVSAAGTAQQAGKAQAKADEATGGEEEEDDEAPPPPPARSAPPAARARALGQAPVVLPPAPAPTLPSGLPPARDVYVRLRSATQVHPVIYVAPSSGYATAAPADVTLQAQVRPTTQAPGLAPTANPAAQPTLQQRLRLLGGKLMGSPGTPDVPPPSTLQPAAPYMPRNPAVAAPAAPRTPAQGSTSWPPAHNVRPGPASTTASLSDRPGVMGVSAAVRLAARPELAPQAPAAPAPPAQALLRIAPRSQPAPAPLMPAASREPAMPVLRIPSRPAPQLSAPAPAAPVSLSPDRVKQLITQAGGNLVRDVRVENGADRRLTVHVHAAPAAEKEVIARLLQVPEIAGSNLRLKIHVAR